MSYKFSALAILALSGCPSVSSSDVLTSGIYADLSAEAIGDGATSITATLYLGSPIDFHYIQLTGTDRLVATADGSTQLMRQADELGIISYAANFSTDSGGTRFNIALERKIDSGAPISIITLPDSFTVNPTSDLISRSRDLTISWDSVLSDDAMQWSVTGPCINEAQGIVAGHHNFLQLPAGRITASTMSNSSACIATVMLSRSRPGEIDPHFGKGGTAVAIQRRTIGFTSVP